MKNLDGIWEDVEKLITEIENLIPNIESEEEKIEKLLPLISTLVDYFKSTITSFSSEVLEDIVDFNKNLNKDFTGPLIMQTENLLNDFKAINKLLNESTQITVDQGSSSKSKITNLMVEVDNACANLFIEIGTENPLQELFSNHKQILEEMSDSTFTWLDDIVSYLYQSIYQFPVFINTKLIPYFKQKKVKENQSLNDAPYLTLGLIIVLQTYISILDSCESNLPATLSGMVGGSVGLEIEGAYSIMKPWIVWAPFKIAAEVIVTTLSTYADLPG